MGINVLKDVNFHLTTKVNIRGLDEKREKDITGCCFMPGGELLVCDLVGVKLFDSSFNLKYVLPYLWGAFDVAALNSTTAAVTVGKEVQLIEVSPSSLQIGNSIKVGKSCSGIDIVAHQICVSCSTPGKKNGEIRIMTLKGTLYGK